MDQKLFVIINAIVVGIILSLFFRGRKKEEPSRLNLDTTTKLSGGPAPRSSYSSAEEHSPDERMVNVIFQYNGHSWEAYEILGLPAGSSKSAAEKAYDKLKKDGKEDLRDLYKAAIQAIRKS